MRDRIRQAASDLGFDLCRFTSAAPPESAHHFREWIEAGRHGTMAWLARNPDRRLNLEAVLPGARSIVCLAASYAREFGLPLDHPVGTGIVARYAQHQDYHLLLSGPLTELAARMDAWGPPGTRSLWYVDTGPILERDLAQRAGIGFTGKNTNLIGKGLGNWVLLAEILTTAELEADPPERNRCGRCTRCLDACPTNAFTAPFTLDARRCISYLTIESKGPIPLELRPALGNRIFGCDDCLEACPWNRFAVDGRLMKEAARADLATPTLIDLLSLDEPGFKARFAGTPMLRSKRRGLLRNVCVALGNTAGPEVLGVLESAAADPELLIAEHAQWAIETIRQRTSSTGR